MSSTRAEIESAVRQGGRSRERWVVVLAGGAGRRLGTLTADAYGRTVPKQYCALRGERSLLQMTLARAARVAPRARQVVVVDGAHEHWWSRELVDLPPENIVVQPADRGTAVGLFLPLTAIQRRSPGAEVVVLPSDHFFGREDVLVDSLEAASAEVARRPGRVVLLGVEARRPDPDLGWIEIDPVAGEGRAHSVRSFHEKPPPSRTRELFERGALANCMILVADLEHLLAFFDRHSPLVERLGALLRETPPSYEELAQLYRDLETLDLSRDLLQSASDEIAVVPLGRCGWADLGTVRGVQECLLRQRPPQLGSLGGCRAPVDLSAPREPRSLGVGISSEELARFAEMI